MHEYCNILRPDFVSWCMQIMSMGNNGAYNMPSIMLPAGMQHFMMNAVPHLTYFSPMGTGMYVGMGCSPLYFPTSQVGATALPGITGNSNIQLMQYGFHGQPFPMPVSDASFLPLLGRLSDQSVRSGTAWPLSSLPLYKYWSARHVVCTPVP